MSDATGAGVATSKYSVDGASASLASEFGFTGQLWLPSVQLYYYKARMYSPQLGRFMQRDPLGYAAGLNLYAYAGGDPVNARDPSGLTTMCIGGALFRIEPKPTNMLDDNSLALLKVETSRDQTPCYELPTAVGGAPSAPNPNRVGVVGDGGQGAGMSQCGYSFAFKCQPSDRLFCYGKAYVMAGNPANIGKQGFPGVSVTNGSAAVIPRQWTGSLTGGPVMRSMGASAIGTVQNTKGQSQSFYGLTQAIGYSKLGSASDVQSMIMARSPGELVLELVGGLDFGKGVAVLFNMPNVGQNCPQGTSGAPQS